MELETEPFDAAAYIRDDDDAAFFLNDAMASGDPAVVAAALGVIARAHGASRLSREAGVSRAALYNGLKPGGNPTLATVMGVMKELGLKLTVQPAAA